MGTILAQFSCANPEAHLDCAKEFSQGFSLDGKNTPVLKPAAAKLTAGSPYSPEATGGAGCKLDSREIVATIIPERNCIVATSLLSNA